MSKYLFILLLLLGITAKANAQEMMLNGSFEDCDGVAPPGTLDPYNIEYGAYWHNIQGTADLINPCVPDLVSGDPCFGNGCGRFGISPTSGVPEYMYGTTLPLTAGQTYEISFWVRKDYMTEENKKIGLVMSETVPTSSIITATPIISFTPENTLCTKVTGCFTAEHSVTHYVVFGPYGGAIGEGIYIIDSVSVTTIPSTTPLAQANLSASEPVLCYGEQVTLDGTASANETSYEWNIYNTSTGNNLFYSSGIIQGTAGTLTPTLQFPIPGSCYRAELTVYGVCKEVATVEFCIADPDIDFIFDGNLVCENFPVDLQVTGDNGWTYTWSDANDTLSSGTGLKTLTVTPTIGNSAYTVTVTTLEGCSYSETLNLNVSSLSTQIPPTMNGIDGTNTYTAYVQAGDALSFNSLISNNNGETVTVSIINNNIPSGHTFTLPPNNQNGGMLSFSWQTQHNTSGTYTFDTYLVDNNACQTANTSYTFRIIVICDYCPVCIDYEDRLPGNNPLPPVTKAGKCIEAGITDTVSTGDNVNVTFQAGGYILEGPHFYAGPGYEAIIDTTTCVLGCQDCCTGFNGFTVDLPIPNIFSPNGDGINDVWFVRDDDHPWCAFGATGFELYIVNVLELNVYQLIDYRGTGCCPFRALYPNPSSIYWDGKINVGTGKGQQVPDGVYFYVLYLHGCGQTATYNGNISIYTTPSGMVQNNDPGTQLNSGLVTDSSGNSVITQPETRLPSDHFYVFPNPTDNFIRIHSGKTITQVCIFDSNGKQVVTLSENFNEPIDLSPFGAGTYRIKALFNDNTIKEQIIVKE